MEDLDLPIPRMVIDDNYVGEPPKVEVTMDNLNDNIDKQFLSNRIEKYGDWEVLNIDYHPETKKHLGLARIVFKQVSSAKDCVAGVHGKSIMGKLVNCYLDPRFLMAKKIFQDLTTEKKPSPEPEVAEEIDEQEEEILNNDDDVGDEYDSYKDRDRGWRDRNSRDGWDKGDRKDWNDHDREDDWGDRRRSRHWHYDEDDYDREYDRGENRSRHRPSRWDKDDRDRGGRWDRDRGRGGDRKERRQSRWDRDDRNSRDQDSRDNHRYQDDRQESENRNPNFWAEAAAKFAAASGDYHDDNAQHPDDVTAPGADTEQGDDDARNLDLDTRLQMLMKNKSANKHFLPG